MQSSQWNLEFKDLGYRDSLHLALQLLFVGLGAIEKRELPLHVLLPRLFSICNMYVAMRQVRLLFILAFNDLLMHLFVKSQPGDSSTKPSALWPSDIAISCSDKPGSPATSDIQTHPSRNQKGKEQQLLSLFLEWTSLIRRQARLCGHGPHLNSQFFFLIVSIASFSFSSRYF